MKFKNSKSAIHNFAESFQSVDCMRTIILFGLLTIASNSFSQWRVIPADSLVKKLRIKSISIYFIEDSSQENITNVLKYDTNSQLISKENLYVLGKSIDLQLYIYKENLLTEVQHIVKLYGKLDTLKTNFFYDSEKRIIKQEENGKYNPRDWQANGYRYSITYNYFTPLIETRTYLDTRDSILKPLKDSLIYNSNKTLKFLFNKVSDIRISNLYNDKLQLTRASFNAISDTTYIIRDYNYIYENGKMVKQIISSHSLRKGEENKLVQKVYNYAYYENGLIKEINRENDREIYKYEFYY